MAENEYSKHSAGKADGKGAHEGFFSERFMVSNDDVSAGAGADIKARKDHLLGVHEESEHGVSNQAAAESDDAFDEKSERKRYCD